MAVPPRKDDPVTYVSYLYNALLWAMALASVVAAVPNLQMAFNMGLLFLGLFIVAFVALLVVRRKDRRPLGLGASLASLIALLTATTIAAGPASMAVVPGAILRQVPGLGALGLGTANLILWALVAVGTVAVVVEGLHHRQDSCADMDADEAALAKTSRISRWATFIVLCVVVVVVASVPAARAWMGLAMAKLSSGDIEAVAELIRSFGPWAAVVSALLMVLQSVAAPVPAFLITFANAAVFGWWQGAILSWASAMAGAALCFYIARFLGREAVAHFVSHGALGSVDRFFSRYGDKAILICRLLPFMSFDYVSYAAGLTSMGFWSFFWATGVGQLPATIVYSYVGGMLTGTAQLVMTALLVIFALFFMVAMIREVFSRRHRDLMAEDAEGIHEAEVRLGDDPAMVDGDTASAGDKPAASSSSGDKPAHLKPSADGSATSTATSDQGKGESAPHGSR